MHWCRNPEEDATRRSEGGYAYVYIYMCVRNWEGYIGEERSAARELWLDLGMSHAF